MAKKKKTVLFYFLQTPLSIKTVISVFVSVVSIVAINNAALAQKQGSPTVISRISQNDLQNVLGTSLMIGEKPQPTNSSTNNPTILYWLGVIKEKPLFRDAYIALSVASFNDHDCQATQYYLQKVQDIDPNYSDLLEMRQQFATCY